MIERLRGRTALVTGAGRGIGQAVAIQLAQAGVAVLLLARSENELRQTARQIHDAGGAASVVAADLAKLGQLTQLARRAGEDHGGIDILVNNAAVVWPFAPSNAIQPADWATAIAINLTAPATLTFALLPGMLERKWGRVVNVSSGVADSPGFLIRANAYTTTKAALEAHTLNLAAELAGTGVTVNVYRPGTVDTTAQSWLRTQPPERIGGAAHQYFNNLHSSGALITPELSAGSLVARLAGQETGQIWNVDDRSGPDR